MQIIAIWTIVNNIVYLYLTKRRIYNALKYLSLSDIWNYIESIRCTATDLSQRVLKAQRNVDEIKFLINQWKDLPLFQRTDKEKTEPLLNLSGIRNIFWVTGVLCIYFAITSITLSMIFAY